MLLLLFFGLLSSMVAVGLVLLLQPACPTCGKTHTVVSGDTCWAIGQANSLTVAQLQALNPNLDQNCDLTVGQVLLLQPACAVIGAYIGYQAYSISPPLSSIPATIGRLYAAFARDSQCVWNNCPAGAGSGNFIAQWDTNTYTPSAILADKQGKNRLWFASLFGSVPYWIDPPNTNTWVNNAFTSLDQNIIQTYHIDGLDIDLENGLTTTWVTCMKTLLTQLKQKYPSLLITLAPFSATWSSYTSLYNAIPSLIDGINYQYYAEGSATDVNAAVNKYKTLASQSGIPLSKFSFMIDTNQGTPRGIQPPYAVQAYQQLRQQNPPIKGLTVWGADDDWHWAGNYNTEITFAQY